LAHRLFFTLFWGKNCTTIYTVLFFGVSLVQQQQQTVIMSLKELKILEQKLPVGAKAQLARELFVDPSKITKAFSGQVKDLKFMRRLQAKSMKMIERHQPITA
jgi:hypothetical protein